MSFQPPDRLDPFLAEAIGIADDARRWMESAGSAAMSGLAPGARLRANAEMLATHARLMAAIAWLLHPAQKTSQMPAFVPLQEPPFGQGHPLEGTDGHDIAAASRALIARLQSIENPSSIENASQKLPSWPA